LATAAGQLLSGGARQLDSAALRNALLDLYEPGMLDALIARLSGVVALWDFSSSSAIADHREYWLDISHFDRDVGTMMIGRIFGNDRIALAIPADFGRLRTSRQN
jgi:hypothetical protein